MKYLFLAEKNSVMRAVQDAYKHNKAAVDAKLGGEVIFTALSGHVCRWLEPSEYDEWKDMQWRNLEMPLTPEPFKIAGSKESYAAGVLAGVKKLVKDEKPDAYIVGTDSDVEGNGIFYLLSKYLHIEDKPTFRFFEQSLTEKEIIHSLLHMTNFYKEARDVRMTDTFITRSQFDWLVGMNATIAITTRSGELYRVGRVKAPTIKLVYDNSMAIENFVPHSDFLVKAEFADGFTGMMLTEDRSEEEVFETEDKAKAFIASITEPECASVVSLEKKKTNQSAPALYKLSSLQGDAGSKYNYSPKETLDTVQELYEKRLLTYPRTDGTCVSSAKAETFAALINTLKHLPELYDHAEKVSPSDIEKVKKNKKVVNDEEVKKSSHDALLPTETIPSDFEKLSKMQQNIYLLVAKRFLAQFLPDKVNESTTLLSDISGRIFRSKGTVTVSPGWSILYKKTSGEDDEKEKEEKIPNSIEKGDKLSVSDIKPHEKVSKPPARLTSATLVTAMENIAKYIDDKHLKDVMKEAKGIGTQATRADIIEQLIKTGYIKCEGKKNALSITDMGKRYMETMKQFSITDPTTAAEWESVFQSVKEGKISREDAKEKTLDYVYDFIDEVAKAEIKIVPRDIQTLDINCPFCKERGKIRKLKWGYACENSIGDGGCHFKLSNFGGKVTDKDVITLSTDGITRKITAISKSKKSGKAFNARLKLIGNTENSIQFAFDDPEELLVKCPYCQGKIFKYEWGYSCENRSTKTCTFAISNKRKKIEITDVEELVLKGKTRIIKGVAISSASKKPFDAALVLCKKGTKNKKGGDQITIFDFGNVPTVSMPEDLKCPYCGGKVIADRFSYRCENNTDKKTCNFYVSMYNGKFTVNDLRDLLGNGETRYIEGLIGQKKKPFTAKFILNRKDEKYATSVEYLNKT